VLIRGSAGKHPRGSDCLDLEAVSLAEITGRLASHLGILGTFHAKVKNSICSVRVVDATCTHQICQAEACRS
jgi:hypothetical protein